MAVALSLHVLAHVGKRHTICYGKSSPGHGTDSMALGLGPVRALPRPYRPLIKQLLRRVAWRRSAAQSRARKIRAILLSALVTGGTPVERWSIPGAADPAPGHLHETNTRSMVLHAEPSDLSVAATEFRTTLDTLGLAQQHVAKIFGVGARSVRRWRCGTRKVPTGVAVLCRLLTSGVITITQIEQAAVPTRTNGGAKEEPPDRAPISSSRRSGRSTPLRAAPAPEEQSASARAKPATLADPGLTTAEKVLALGERSCRWPSGDPGRPDFFFCSAPTIGSPYCPRHSAQAYLAPQPGRGHGVRVGFLAHGHHGRPSISGAFSATGASRPPKILFDRAGALPGSAPPSA